jgi:isocitrate dehydrogenase
LEIATAPEANIIKLPNISASVPKKKQLNCNRTYNIPNFPEDPQNRRERN